MRYLLLITFFTIFSVSAAVASDASLPLCESEECFKGYKINTKTFYIFDRNYDGIVQEFYMNTIFNKPLYAYTKHKDNPKSRKKARVIAILYPKKRTVGDNNYKPFIIAMAGGNIQDPDNHNLYSIVVTDSYNFVNIKNISTDSGWMINNNVGEVASLIEYVVSDSQPFHQRYWHINTVGAGIKNKTHNGNEFTTTGIVMPAFIQKRDIGRHEPYFLTGYTSNGLILKWSTTNEHAIIDSELSKF